MSMTEKKIERIAATVHEVNKAVCEAQGDHSQKHWHEAEQWQKDSVVAGVRSMIKDLSTTPSQSHANWLQHKLDEGWKYGPVKDAEKKTHPCILPYEKLSFEQRIKDVIFTSLARTLLIESTEVIWADEGAAETKPEEPKPTPELIFTFYYANGDRSLTLRGYPSLPSVGEFVQIVRDRVEIKGEVVKVLHTVAEQRKTGHVETQPAILHAHIEIKPPAEKPAETNQDGFAIPRHQNSNVTFHQDGCDEFVAFDDYENYLPSIGERVKVEGEISGKKRMVYGLVRDIYHAIDTEGHSVTVVYVQR